MRRGEKISGGDVPRRRRDLRGSGARAPSICTKFLDGLLCIIYIRVDVVRVRGSFGDGRCV